MKVGLWVILTYCGPPDTVISIKLYTTENKELQNNVTTIHLTNVLMELQQLIVKNKYNYVLIGIVYQMFNKLLIE